MNRTLTQDIGSAVEDIWNSLILLQSIFSPINNQGSSSMEQIYIDDAYASLRRLFSRYRDYQAIQDQSGHSNSSPDRQKFEKLERYFVALRNFWQQNKKLISGINSRSPDLLVETRETLKQIIKQHSGVIKSASVKYHSPIPSKGQAGESEARQRTEPHLRIIEQREKELLLKKCQLTNQVLQEENQNLMRLNEQYRGIEEETAKKDNKIQNLEIQLDVMRRKANQDRYESNRTGEDEVYQLKQEKQRLAKEVNNFKLIMSEMDSNSKSLPQSKSENEFKFLLNQQKSEIENLKLKLVEKEKEKGRNKSLNQAEKKLKQQIQHLEVEVVSLKNQMEYNEHQIAQSKSKNKSLKEFIEDKLSKNLSQMQQINALQHENEDLKAESNVGQLEQENQNILNENERLSQKISDLYMEINQRNNSKDDQRVLKQLQLQNQVLQEQVQKASDDRKRLTSQLEMMKKEINDRDLIIQNMQMKKQQKQDDMIVLANSVGDLETDIAKDQEIRFLPDLGVGSHFNCVIHVLESVSSFSQILAQNLDLDESCQILQRFFDHIRGNHELDLKQLQSDATQLTDLILIDQQVDNRANDFLFQMIDSFSKIIVTDENEQNAIARIIQQKESPIYDIFFFLQRSLPVTEEIQINETPLINSIKHVRYIEPQVNECDNLAQYINQLITLEGEENGSSSFNFVVLPSILILNVYELSQARCEMSINEYIELSAFTNEPQQGETFQYKLQGMINFSQSLEDGGNDPLYYLTISTPTGWIQVLYDQFERIHKIDPLLSFRENQGDKELLIYEKVVLI